MTLRRISVTAFIVLSLPVWARAGAGLSDMAGEDPPMFFLMLALLAGLIGACLLAAALLLISSVIGAGLLTAGIITASAIQAWRRRSFSAGLRLMITLIITGGGAAVGAASCWLFSLLYDGMAQLLLMFCAALAGAIAGRLLAATFMKIAQHIAGRLLRPGGRSDA